MRLFLIISLYIISTALSAQQVSFKTMLIDGYSNWGMSAIETDSTYILVGEGYALQIVNNDSFAVWKIKFHKFDKNGNHLASNEVGDFWHIWGNGGRGNAIQTSDGNFMIAGYKQDTSKLRYPVLIKFDGNMDTIWVRQYVGNGNWVFNDIKETSDKGFIIAGWEDYYSYQPADIRLCKVDSLGNLVWGTRNFKPEVNYPNNIESLPDGGFIVAGNYFQNNRVETNTGYLAKFDVNGDLVWDTLIGTQGQDGELRMDRLSDGNFLAFGSISGDNWGIPQLTKFDAEGNFIWQKRLNLHQKSLIIQCDEMSNKDIVCAGVIRTDSIFGNIGWIVWLDSLGEVKKEQAYMYWPLNNGFIGDGVSFYDIIETSDGGFLIGGAVAEPARMGWYANQFLLLKLDSNGCVVDDCGFFTSIFEHVYEDEIKAIVYPNPTTGILNIDVQAKNVTEAKLEIFDYLGRSVYETLVNIGKNQLSLELPNGFYLYQINTQTKLIGSGKIVIN